MNKKEIVKIKQGYLVKKGHIRHNWKTRWFVLYEDSLCYYKKKHDSEPVGIIRLQGAAVIEETPDYVNTKRQNVLKLITQETIEYYLQACSPEDRTQWTIAIGDVIRAKDSARLKTMLPFTISFKSFSGQDIQLNIRDFVTAMQDPDAGILVSDHIIQKSTYSNCFTGRDLIEWLKSWSFVSNESDGVSLGSVLLNIAVIQYVVDSTAQISASELFSNSTNVLYRFSSLRARHGKRLRTFTTLSLDSSTSADQLRIPGKIVKEGFLVKQGHIRLNWKVRKIVLKEQPSQLEYYALSKISSKPLRCLSLENCLVLPIQRQNFTLQSRDQHEVRDNLFCVMMYSGIQYFFQAKSSDERHEWVEAIRALVFSSC